MTDKKENINSNDNDDSQRQNERDRVIRGNRQNSSGKYKRLKNRELWKIKFAKRLIDDLKNYGPAGLIHIKALNRVTGKPIRIWKPDGCLYRTINNTNSGNLIKLAIDIEYHEQTPNYIGHWTLLGNKDPVNVGTDLNACLFAVVAVQTGKSVTDLRTDTINFLTNNIKYLIDQIDTHASSNNDNNETSLMIGGARYAGTSPTAAGIILDKSQNVYCHECNYTGHPRGHASHSKATGPYDSVQNYSQHTKSMKSGFLNRCDQNRIAHLFLKHPTAQQAMQDLNNGMVSVLVKLSSHELETDGHAIPKMIVCYNGETMYDGLDIVRCVAVLRHHQGKHTDPKADVFVHTFYPTSN